MPPEDVTKDNEETVRISTFLTDQKGDSVKIKHLRYRFKIGDRVRLTPLRYIFTRQYDERWTGEIVTVFQRFWRESVPIYRLNDYHGEEIKGTFYQSELQKIELQDDKMWKIEKVIKTKGKGQNKKMYVKWLYWPSKFSSWVNARDVEDI